MRICFIGDPRSVHTRRWVGWFAGRHEVSLIRTAPDAADGDVPGPVLPEAGPVPGSRLLSSVAGVRRHLREFRPDVLHAHYINESGWFAGFAGWRPYVVTAWGSDVYRAPQESWLARRLNPHVVRRADHVTCDSRDQASVLASWGVASERLSVIGWGVDLGEFNAGVSGARLRARLEVPQDVPVVLSPRQWLPNSHVEAIVAAHARLPEDVFLVLKRIPRFEEDGGRSVEAAIAASPARARIRVIGEIEAGELPELYAVSDVVASLCETDGTPVSVLEAMALGKPIVAYRNASLAEWVEPPGGALVDDHAPETIARALAPLLTDAAARRAAAAHNREVIARRADRAAEMSSMESIYERVVQSRRAAGVRHA